MGRFVYLRRCCTGGACAEAWGVTVSAVDTMGGLRPLSENLMPRFRPRFVLLLLAIWLPASLHCGLASAGVLEADEAVLPVSAVPQSCDSGFCHAVEGKIVQAASERTVPKAPTPAPRDFRLVCLLLKALASEARSTPEPERSLVPPELLPTWQFVRRTASPPRAPSSLV